MNVYLVILLVSLIVIFALNYARLFYLRECLAQGLLTTFGLAFSTVTLILYIVLCLVHEL